MVVDLPLCLSILLCRNWVTTGVVDLVFAFPREYVHIQCVLYKSVEGRLVLTGVCCLTLTDKENTEPCPIQNWFDRNRCSSRHFCRFNGILIW